MHELAVTESVVDAVTDRLGDVPVVRVRLAIGRLSGVVPDAVRFAFDLVTAGTSLDGAVLEIDEPPGRIRCRSCGATADTGDPVAGCTCGSLDVEVTDGQDLRIVAVEVASRV